MSFEVREKDLFARIGKLTTKSGSIETPLLLPVISPTEKLISPNIMATEFGCSAIMTNAYLFHKHFKDVQDLDVHRFLDFPGTIMTDSGAYQILVYGDVAVTADEILRYQERINTDIATILDVPTGWDVTQRQAQTSVSETLKRAREWAALKSRQDILWTGPIQGGDDLELIAFSAREMAKLPFSIYALGSPTPIMERYLFDKLVDMIMTAKLNLPVESPLHLFGAGHPFMFALAVALGCDLFDSAAYARFAKADRYLTAYGTVALPELKSFPCSCPECCSHDPHDLVDLPKPERVRFLATHNLHVSFAEIRRIKQAIAEGRLWEHVTLRAYNHPALYQAFRQLVKYAAYLEHDTPVIKRRGLFFFTSDSLARPEVLRYRTKLLSRYTPPQGAEILVLLPSTRTKPFPKSKEHRRAWNVIITTLGNKVSALHVCTYAAPYGVVPWELSDIYPLSQFEITNPLDSTMMDYLSTQIADYIANTNYKHVVLLQEPETEDNELSIACQHACEQKGIPFTAIQRTSPWTKQSLAELAEAIQLACRRH